MEAHLQGEEEAVAPFTGGHVRRLPRVLGRQFVVEREDDGLFAWEIAVEKANADPCFLRDISKGCRVIAASGDQVGRGGIQAIPCCGALRCWTGRTPPFTRLDIFSE